MSTQKFRGKAVDMLTICQIIVQQADADKEFLISQRPLWADPFFSNHLARISGIFTGILGVSNIAEQRRSTQIVNAIHHEALNDVHIFKVQIEQDFRKNAIRRDEILRTLGLALLPKAKNSQESLVQLLYQFKSNLTDDLRNEITAKGIAEHTLNKIVVHADQLLHANVTQEILKGTTKVMSRQAIEIFNDIYSDTIAIAIIARRLFSNDKARQDIYSYTKTLQKLNNAAAAKRKDFDGEV